MAKPRQGVSKRQREAKKAQKTAAKQARREERRDSVTDPVEAPVPAQVGDGALEKRPLISTSGSGTTLPASTTALGTAVR